MRLEHISQKKLEKDLLTIIGKHLELKSYKVFFFGSRVTERSSERSDIDVGIEGKRSVPYSTLSKIKEDIENLPTLYSIDIVDFKSASKDFLEVAHEKIELFHP